MNNYEVGKVYLAKCKSNILRDWLEIGEYYRCMIKRFGERGFLWYTTPPKEAGGGDFSYSWDDLSFTMTFEPPIPQLQAKDFKAGCYYKCIEDFYMEDGTVEFTRNKMYRVDIVLGNFIVFIDNTGDEHSMEEEDLSYFVKPTFNTEPKETPAWQFLDNEINWENLENDLLQDNIPLAIVEGEGCSYVVGIDNEKYEWGKVFDKLIWGEYWGETLNFSAFKIKKGKEQEVKDLCKIYSKKYKNYVKGLHKHITNRNRRKINPKRFKVFTY